MSGFVQVTRGFGPQARRLPITAGRHTAPTSPRDGAARPSPARPA
ncbi:MAG: hypothetical protein ACK4VY_00890 [Brevundimonas sp.]